MKRVNKLKWPTKTEEHAYMKERQEQNKVLSKRNPNENWMRDKLSATGLKWTRQAQWGYRIFDFWNRELGIAVEVDGLSHNKVYDSIRDDYNYRRSGILVLRVKNMNEDDVAEALSRIAHADTWWDRRRKLNIPLTKAEERKINENSHKRLST